jgi:hypothetical protein
VISKKIFARSRAQRAGGQKKQRGGFNGAGFGRTERPGPAGRQLTRRAPQLVLDPLSAGRDPIGLHAFSPEWLSAVYEENFTQKKKKPPPMFIGEGFQLRL